jgi:hypothetical protein
MLIRHEHCPLVQRPHDLLLQRERRPPARRLHLSRRGLGTPADREDVGNLRQRLPAREFLAEERREVGRETDWP